MTHRLSFAVFAISAALAPLRAQESHALVHAPRVVIGVDNPPFQALGDFDGDGDLDIVGTRHHQSGSASQVYVWRNDGGALTHVNTLATGGLGLALATNTVPIVVADLNGDGLDDFVVATHSSVVRYFAGPGMQFSVQPSWWLVGAQTGKRALAKGDFDADGLVDVAVAAPSNSAFHLYVFFGSGAWTSLAGSALMPSVAEVRLGTYDLDGQPGDDLLLFQKGSYQADAYAVQNGQLVIQQSFSCQLTQPVTTPWLWTGGDIDNDGDTDLVVFKPGYSSFDDDEYQVFRRAGPATFVAEQAAVGGPAEYLADLDGDGDLDGVCCGGGGGSNYNWPKLDFASTFELAINTGGGAFAEACTVPGAGSESLAGVADLDSDGDVELVAGRCVFYGDGPWNEPPAPIAGDAIAFSRGRRVDLHDVDRDGDPDYYGAINRGDGYFVAAPPEPPAPMGNNYSGWAIPCDVDGDGVRDRIRMQSGAVTGMVWQRNNGGGHYEYGGLVAPAGVIFGSGVSLTHDTFCVDDFDGDGDEDIAVHGTGELWWNQGGTFAATPELLPVAGDIDGVGDFDGDGVRDIAMHDAQNEYVLLGTGQPGSAFAQAWSHAFQVNQYFDPGVALVADLNGDGRDDILRPNVNVQFFINQTPANGALAFTLHTLSSSAVWHSVGAAAAERPSVTVADFDGDGARDIGVARLLGQPNVYSLLLRDSADPNVHTYTERLFAIRDGHAADADGDGDVDLIGVRTTRNRLVGRIGGGRRTQRYDGVVGENGAAPVLGGTGPYVAGGFHTLRLTGVPGPASALIALSIGDAFLPDNPLPGLTLYLDPAWLLVGAMPITQDGQGRAAAMTTLPLPIFPGTQGWTFHLQAFVPDASAPALYTHSNLLSLRVGG